jgi:hypothetical protein
MGRRDRAGRGFVRGVRWRVCSRLLGTRVQLPAGAVEDPYTAPGGMAPDGRTLLANLYLDIIEPQDMPVVVVATP